MPNNASNTARLQDKINIVLSTHPAILYLPMFTRYIPSFLVIKSRASCKFSIFWACTLGFLLYLPTLFWDSTSNSIIRQRPSEKSSPISLMLCPESCFFRCSLHHLVKVFFWILFHSASIAASDKLMAASFSIAFSGWSLQACKNNYYWTKLQLINLHFQYKSYFKRTVSLIIILDCTLPA